MDTINKAINRLSVHGSRTLNDERVKILILEEIEKYHVIEIVTPAEPDGVCRVARDLCKEKAIPLKLHFLNFKFLRGAFEHRPKSVLNDADRALFIHDGESKGTSNEVALAKKLNIPYTYHQIEKTAYKSSVGFDITEEWVLDLPTPDLSELESLRLGSQRDKTGY